MLGFIIVGLLPCSLIENVLFQLNLLLRRATPKEVSDVDFAFNPKGGISPVFTSKTSYTKSVYWRYSEEEIAKEKATNINNGTYCMTCGDPKNCTKKLFKKWE